MTDALLQNASKEQLHIKPSSTLAGLGSLNDSKFYLDSSSGYFGLQKDHDYYYQVQCQLAVCEKPYCDFVCWTTKGIFVERVKRDPDFFKSAVPKVKSIFMKCLLPELLARNLQSSSDVDTGDFVKQDKMETFCICDQPEFGDMVATTPTA